MYHESFQEENIAYTDLARERENVCHSAVSWRKRSLLHQPQLSLSNEGSYAKKPHQIIIKLASYALMFCYFVKKILAYAFVISKSQNPNQYNV